MKLELFRQIFEKKFVSDFMKIRPMKTALLFADRHDQADSYFSQFCQRT